MRHFTPTQLQEYLQTTKDQPLLLDVREPWEYEICHSQYAPLHFQKMTQRPASGAGLMILFVL